MMIDRQTVIQEARSWLGTPFHHQAALKGIGADCIGLVRGVCMALGILPRDFALPAYARQPDGTSLIALADHYMARITDASPADLKPGDVVVVSFDREPQHFGLVGDYRHGGLSVIHAHSVAGEVIETRLLFGLGMAFVAAYHLPGVSTSWPL